MSEPTIDMITPQLQTEDNLSSALSTSTEDNLSTTDTLTEETPKEEPPKETTQPEEKEIGEKNNLYTPEELEYLMASEEEVDTKRLTSEGQALMKQFQKVYTKKFMSLADERKKFEQQKTQQTQQTKDDFLYTEFKRNPESVIADINSEISKLKDDPYNEENIKKIDILSNAKEKLFLRKMQEGDADTRSQKIMSEAQAEVLSAIPDYQEKQPKLSTFGKSLGLTDEDIAYITNPLNTGKYAAKLTITLNKAYDMINAGQTAEKKIVKQTPKPLARPGSSSQKDLTTFDPGDMSYSDYKTWREKKGY